MKTGKAGLQRGLAPREAMAEEGRALRPGSTSPVGQREAAAGRLPSSTGRAPCPTQQRCLVGPGPSGWPTCHPHPEETHPARPLLWLPGRL